MKITSKGKSTEDDLILRYNFVEPILQLEISDGFHSHIRSKGLDHRSNRYSLNPCVSSDVTRSKV